MELYFWLEKGHWCITSTPEPPLYLTGLIACSGHFTFDLIYQVTEQFHRFARPSFIDYVSKISSEMIMVGVVDGGKGKGKDEKGEIREQKYRYKTYGHAGHKSERTFYIGAPVSIDLLAKEKEEQQDTKRKMYTEDVAVAVFINQNFDGDSGLDKIRFYFERLYFTNAEYIKLISVDN